MRRTTDSDTSSLLPCGTCAQRVSQRFGACHGMISSRACWSQSCPPTRPGPAPAATSLRDRVCLEPLLTARARQTGRLGRLAWESWTRRLFSTTVWGSPGGDDSDWQAARRQHGPPDTDTAARPLPSVTPAGDRTAVVNMMLALKADWGPRTRWGPLRPVTAPLPTPGRVLVDSSEIRGGGAGITAAQVHNSRSCPRRTWPRTGRAGLFLRLRRSPA